jgi:hypothetical protein
MFAGPGVKFLLFLSKFIQNPNVLRKFGNNGPTVKTFFGRESNQEMDNKIEIYCREAVRVLSGLN